MNESDKEKLREFFIKYQLMHKLGVEGEYTREEYKLYNTMRDQHFDEYVALWEEIAEIYNGEPWMGK